MALALSSPLPPSPPSGSPTPYHASEQSLPPLNTTHPLRRASQQRPQSYAFRRMSAFSANVRASEPSQSRPTSHAFPVFHSSLPYTLVRDFAYPLTHPAHYGPPPTDSGLTTPASETRRLSDPEISSWDDSGGAWSATPPWSSESAPASSTREQLPAMTFTDGGPPYSEDEDLHSPIVTTSRHRRHKSSSHMERGRSPGDAAYGRGVFVGINGDGSETYYIKHPRGRYEGAGGPGSEYVTYPLEQSHQSLSVPEHHDYHPQRDSHFAASISQREEQASSVQQREVEYDSEQDFSETDEEARYSREYSFTIASPDEEMHGKAVALFDFESEHQNELPLTEGQIILVSYRHGQGWLVAQDPKTGESGLVPEEFVRLVRDIEGGLNSLTNAGDMDGSGEQENGGDALSPASAGQESVTTPTSSQPDANKSHPRQPSSGSTLGEKHPSVQSFFSTSSKDLEKYPLPDKATEEVSTPTLPNHVEMR